MRTGECFTPFVLGINSTLPHTSLKRPEQGPASPGSGFHPSVSLFPPLSSLPQPSCGGFSSLSSSGPWFILPGKPLILQVWGEPPSSMLSLQGLPVPPETQPGCSVASPTCSARAHVACHTQHARAHEEPCSSSQGACASLSWEKKGSFSFCLFCFVLK